MSKKKNKLSSKTYTTEASASKKQSENETHIPDPENATEAFHKLIKQEGDEKQEEKKDGNV